MHCFATCKLKSTSFHITLTYAFHTIITRRPLWNNIVELNLHYSTPWLLHSDFDNVLRDDERCNGPPGTPYEIKDFLDCWMDTGLSDLRSIGCLYTWTNHMVWNKLDEAMVNSCSLQAGFFELANFLPSGCSSDHSPCITTLLQLDICKRRSFKFFIIWAGLGNFHDLVQSSWNQMVSETR